MLLTSFTYKSFLDHSPITFGPGFNIITGKNNAGKTALIEGLSLKFSNNPHRSSKTVPTPAHSLSTPSSAQFKIVVSQDDMAEVIRESNDMLIMPSSADGTRIGEILDRITGLRRLELDLSYTASINQLGFAGDAAFR
ncbi:MAG TPA: AAA family ATPase [Myxococcus sp.]|nr:AAA family ATPase [Myxococcus sp.]